MTDAPPESATLAVVGPTDTWSGYARGVLTWTTDVPLWSHT